jgi:fructoselysine 6-phosphate deglycase
MEHDMNPDVEKSVQAALAALRERKSLRSVFLVACGGSFSQMHVAKYAMDREARTLVADSYNAAEFVMRDLPRVGPDALVILCSSSGGTPETVAAARYARARGAYVVGLTTKPDSELAHAADTAIGYESLPAVGSGDAVAAILLRLVFGLLRDREGNTRTDALMRSLPCLPQLVERAQAAVAPAVLRWAEQNKRASISTVPSRSPISTCPSWWPRAPARAGRWTHGRSPSRANSRTRSRWSISRRSTSRESIQK